MNEQQLAVSGDAEVAALKKAADEAARLSRGVLEGNAALKNQLSQMNNKLRDSNAAVFKMKQHLKLLSELQRSRELADELLMKALRSGPGTCSEWAAQVGEVKGILERLTSPPASFSNSNDD